MIFVRLYSVQIGNWLQVLESIMPLSVIIASVKVIPSEVLEFFDAPLMAQQ